MHQPFFDLFFYFVYLTLTKDKSLNTSTILIISTLLLVGTVLRLWHIDYQSLWLDEMHTMLFSDPTTSWAKYWQEVGADVHPPLYYTLLRILFATIAYTSVMARTVSAIAGILSIWAIFLLGREIRDNKLGLVAAAITTLNYYTISFSQEARNYMLAFLLVTFSFLYLIRLLKTLQLKHSIWYGMYTLLLLYCHYYAVFVICAQVLIGLIFFANEPKENRVLFIKRFLLSAAIVTIGFSPWIQFLSSVTAVKTTWIPMPSSRFAIEYFNEYFGNSALLVPIFAACILYYVIYTLLSPLRGKKLKENPIWLGLIICGIWVSVTYLLPYLRSLTAVPMLYGRYTIVVLPALIICIAYGIVQIKYYIISIAILGFVLVESFIDLTSKKDYYTRITKTQFREMITNVAQNYQDNALIVDEMSTQQWYYFKTLHIQPNIIEIPKVEFADAVLLRESKYYHIKQFWIIGGHQEKQLDSNTRTQLEQYYTRLCNAQYVDAWAEYYVLKTDTGLGISYIDYHDIDKNTGTAIGTDAVLQSGSMQFMPRKLPAGKYQFIVSASGTIANELYPDISISLNGKKLGDLQTTKDTTIATFYWETSSDTSASFCITLMNDAKDAANNADRDAYIHFIRIKKLN